MSWNANPHEETTATIINDGWWPDISLKDFQDSQISTADFSEALCIKHLKLAMIWTNGQLTEWKQTQVAADFTSLADVPAESVGGETKYQTLYVHAVYSYAKGILLRQFPTIGRKDVAKHEGIEAPDAEAKFLQYADEAISDFLGRTRIKAVLI